jgi:hypothetical protein
LRGSAVTPYRVASHDDAERFSLRTCRSDPANLRGSRLPESPNPMRVAGFQDDGYSGRILGCHNRRRRASILNRASLPGDRLFRPRTAIWMKAKQLSVRPVSIAMSGRRFAWHHRLRRRMRDSIRPRIIRQRFRAARSAPSSRATRRCHAAGTPVFLRTRCLCNSSWLTDSLPPSLPVGLALRGFHRGIAASEQHGPVDWRLQRAVRPPGRCGRHNVNSSRGQRSDQGRLITYP